MFINTLSINDRRGYKSYRLMIDVGTAGINGDTVRGTIFPAMLDKPGIEYDSFELYDFRYYLGQPIYKVRLRGSSSKYPKCERSIRFKRSIKGLTLTP